MIRSALVGLPLLLTAARPDRANLIARGQAGLQSLGVGLFMIYEIGAVKGLIR